MAWCVALQVEGYSACEQNLPLQQLGHELAEKIFQQVADVLARTLRKLRLAGRRHFFTLPNCWELFGADFLLQAAKEPRALLLEVNPSPSLAMYDNVHLEDPLSTVPSNWHELQV